MFRKYTEKTCDQKFSESRMKIQDDIVSKMVSVTTSDSSSLKRCNCPWLIIVWGPIGSGKSYLIDMILEYSYIPFSNVVYLDMNRAESLLPEASRLKSRCPCLLAKSVKYESQLIVELALYQALYDGNPVVLESSLMLSLPWWNYHIPRLNELFPGLKISLCHVSCERERAWNRILARNTAQYIPYESFVESLQVSNNSCLSCLFPFVDIMVDIDNSGTDDPMIISPMGTNWASLKYMFLIEDDAISTQEFNSKAKLTPQSKNSRCFLCSLDGLVGPWKLSQCSFFQDIHEVHEIPKSSRRSRHRRMVIESDEDIQESEDDDELVIVSSENKMPNHQPLMSTGSSNKDTSLQVMSSKHSMLRKTDSMELKYHSAKRVPRISLENRKEKSVFQSSRI